MIADKNRKEVIYTVWGNIKEPSVGIGVLRTLWQFHYMEPIYIQEFFTFLTYLSHNSASKKGIVIMSHDDPYPGCLAEKTVLSH